MHELLALWMTFLAYKLMIFIQSNCLNLCLSPCHKLMEVWIKFTH